MDVTAPLLLPTALQAAPTSKGACRTCSGRCCSSWPAPSAVVTATQHWGPAPPLGRPGLELLQATHSNAHGMLLLLLLPPTTLAPSKGTPGSGC